MLKKISLAVMGLTACGLAAAGDMGEGCIPGLVTVPCKAQHWELGLQGLYLKQGFSASNGYLPASGDVVYAQADNDWSWGFRLEASYLFNTGNDLNINWLHYKNTFTQAQGSPLDLIYLNEQDFQYGLDSENTLDQINAVLGQHVDFGLVKKMRFYGGLQYARIQDQAYNYTDGVLVIVQRPRPPALLPTPATAPGAYNYSETNSSTFSGVGPTIGIDYAYYLTEAFSVTANGSGSILYGTSTYNGAILSTIPGTVVAAISASKNAIVPSLESKLGVNYAYNMPQGQLNIQGGYMALNYFNAIQTLGSAGFLGSLSDSNYGLYGPYFGVNYIGNI